MTLASRATAAAILLLAGTPAAAQTQGVSAGPVDYPAGVAPAGTLRLFAQVERSENGRVAACRITQPSGEPRLDEEACRILRERALLVPAEAFRTGTIEFRWAGLRPTPELNERGAPLLYFSRFHMRDADYPRAAVRARQQGAVVYRLSVSAEGRPTACAIVQSAGFPLLDEATCTMMNRAWFIPASDGRGGLAPGDYVGRLVWRL